MYRLLLIDMDENHAERLTVRLRERNLRVKVVASVEDAIQQLQQRLPPFELVLAVASEVPEPWLISLRKLVHIGRQSVTCHSPSFLLASRQKLSPRIRLGVQRLGVRYVHER